MKVVTLVLQDLEYLSEGLEGRSSNPVAVLFDTLLHPDADFGYDYPPVLHWKLEQHNYIPHIVFGKGPPGGAWHVSKYFILLDGNLIILWSRNCLAKVVLDGNGNFIYQRSSMLEMKHYP